MGIDWKHWCVSNNIRLVDGRIEVDLSNRKHIIEIDETENSVSVKGRVLYSPEDKNTFAIYIWSKNRLCDLVGFYFKENRLIWGEAWIPKDGLTREEFQFYIRHVAIECDRLEYVLTGKDIG